MTPEIRSKASLRRPYLLFRVGYFGCLPIGFERDAASELSLDYVSRNSVTRTSAAGARGPISEPVRRMNKCVVSTLKNGQGMLIDKAYNSIIAREKISKIASYGEATLVALNVETPQSVIDERLATLGLGPTSGRVERPIGSERIDIIIDLQGELDTPDLIEQIRPSLS